jgi:hypothetical protein
MHPLEAHIVNFSLFPVNLGKTPQGRVGSDRTVAAGTVVRATDLYRPSSNQRVEEGKLVTTITF